MGPGMSLLHLRRSLASTTGNALPRVLLAVLSASVLACGASATVTRSSGAAVVGQIVRADAQAVAVVLDDGRTVTVPRRVIEDIDHPGNVAGILGTAVGIGALIAAPAGVCGPSNDDRLPCLGVLGLSATGLWFGIDGWLRYSRSTTAANSSMPVYDTFYGGTGATGGAGASAATFTDE